MKLKVSFMICTWVLVLFSLESRAQSQKFKGFPDKSGKLDVLPGFVQPPKGYGNVPFYWWNGDTLVRERLEEQLDILAASATDGFAVSYIHTHPRIDTLENKNGYGLFGRTEPGAPGVFSDTWWDTWNWFSGACQKRGLGAGLDDYTVGWVGNGYYPDELDTMSVFKGYSGELVIKIDTVQGGTLYQADLPGNSNATNNSYVPGNSHAPGDLLYIVAWPGQIDLTKHITNGKIQWDVPQGKTYKVYTITTKPGYVLHPEHGRRLVDVYFNRFETKMDASGREGMNYFFQDELAYPIQIGSWSDDFADEFRKRKGYDILPYLPALEDHIGAITPKIRMDYCEVLMDLSEERYYKPIYDWHADRGLIYGCDNLSRGLNPIAYIDYFRAMAWFTAPGNDAPARGSSFIQTKVSSSITHLYNRERTWLEAFHSMGWGSSGAWLTQQIDHHFIAGGNLVCMHGLYYSTHGGWWEWAPPDFHFRMPYWPHMKQWLSYTERMSYLLSQGSHVCDIAILYPTESMQAYPGTKPDVTFDVARKLSFSGLDYDFIDFRSLREAEILDVFGKKGSSSTNISAERGTGLTSISDERKAGVPDKRLKISDEQYKIIVLADLKAIDHAALQKIVDFYRAGGIVLATGNIPAASNKSGEGANDVDQFIKELFGFSANEAKPALPEKQTNSAGGIGWYIADSALEKHIPNLITPDFLPEKGIGKVLHRKTGERDIYMVVDVEKDTECFFRNKGKAELWDANTGTTQPYPILRQTDEGSWLRMNKETSNSYLIVFSPGEPQMEHSTEKEQPLQTQIPIDGDWEVELLPTLNNKWGDYRFPASDGFISAEARAFRYVPAILSDKDWIKPTFDDTSWPEEIYGYGPQVETKADGLNEWQPVSFSWQYGVWDNPGAQGYHGLKGKVDNRFFILDKGNNQQFRTYVYAPQNGSFRIETEGITPDFIRINQQETKGAITLKKGWHLLEAGYSGTEKVDYKIATGSTDDKRKRSFVVLYPVGQPLPIQPSLYANTISSRWENSGQLMFDPYGGKYDTWNFRFTAVPGLEAMTFTVNGKDLRLWLEGQEIPKANIQLIKNEANWNTYQIVLKQKQEKPVHIAFSVKAEPGYQGTAVIKEPVCLKTSTGLLTAGDWSETGALRYYSGGMYYRKNIRLNSADLKNKQIRLDLGDVIATCEVKVNDQSAGILISPPYQSDITPYVKEGDNQIEILVYSTLSNHYQTIPTPYKGNPKAGLIGPVRLSFTP